MNQALTTQPPPLLLTENGYLLCYRHATAWIAGGSPVIMRPPSMAEYVQFGSECADCAEEDR